jgi:hypothetical protein
MYIPESVKVRVRHDKQYDNATTAKTNNIPLGFVTFVDEKGVLKKEKSWNGWGDEYIGEFPNKPVSGYKLENMVTRSRHYYGSGRTLYRVIHPDGFAFEISTDNLFEICMEGNVKNGEFLGSYLLAWEGQTLILLGEESSDYSKYVEVTKIVHQGHVSLGNLVVGQPYQDKNGKYIGHYYGKFPAITINYKSKPNERDQWGYAKSYEYAFEAKSQKKYKHIFIYELVYEYDVEQKIRMISSMHNTIAPYPYVGDPKNIDISKYSIHDVNADHYNEKVINTYKSLDEVKPLITEIVEAYAKKSSTQRYSDREVTSPYTVDIKWNTFPKACK